MIVLNITPRLAGLTLLGMFLFIASPSAHAIRCGTNLISKGDLALEVKQHCGEPYWIDRWYDEIVYGEETDFERRISNIIERWVYNSGPNHLIRFVTIRNNRVESIETGGHGFNVSKSMRDCDTDKFSLGMTSVEVQQKCGQPDSTARRQETVTTPLAPGVRQKTTAAIDEWVYNYGPQSFMRILKFYNGTLIHIETGPRGF